TGMQKLRTKSKKLASQLKEEAERTERPNQEIKSNHWEKLEEGRSVTSVAAEFELFSQHRFTTLETISKLQEHLSGGSVVVHEEPPAQMTGILHCLTGQKKQAADSGRNQADTRHRRLDDRYRVLPWPEDCTVVVCFTRRPLYGVYLYRLPIGEGVLCGAGNTGIERQ
ncbi:hypothetical protein TNCV_441971, partial [Trichonephila clavipes]